jgi:hypothetical protein
MKNNIKILKLVEAGFKTKNLMSMTERQINVLHSRLMEQVNPVTSTKTKYEIGNEGGSLPPSPKGYSVKKGSDGKVIAEPNEGEVSEDITSSNALGDLDMQKLTGQETPHDADDMAPDGMDDDSDNDRSEMQEKAVSKQQQKFFGVVKSMQDGDTPKEGKAGKVAKEMSKKDVMDFVNTKLKGLPKKKETKETLKFESMIEKKLIQIVEKHLPIKISKKDFINLVSESPEISPTKPTVKPGTKPNRPSTPYNPKPGPKPAPKAEKNDMPEWLSFNKIGVKLKEY